MESTQGERLNELRLAKNKSWNKFARDLELGGPATLYLIRDNKREISPEMTGRIKKAYSDCNTHWLLTGEGEMLLNEKIEQNDISEIKSELAEIKDLLQQCLEVLKGGGEKAVSG